jgi:DNA-binding transcriptional MerR regulator
MTGDVQPRRLDSMIAQTTQPENPEGGLSIAQAALRTGVSVHTLRYYERAGLVVTAGHGNEQERLELMEAHRADVLAKLAELQENLELIDHKIGVYNGRVAAGDADQLWAPRRPAGAR